MVARQLVPAGSGVRFTGYFTHGVLKHDFPWLHSSCECLSCAPGSTIALLAYVETS
jgi:hypothetical protein